ncbi:MULTISPECIES: hypothetical protein [unclassified Xanthobacter]|uniref:hypothetical protein n=1 Tax=unclassified Xanthobacter TaxID=2623496 RepID=UPI001F304335|nr:MULTISPECIES: hypothetical protein [unclassified Xanthobacter]
MSENGQGNRSNKMVAILASLVIGAAIGAVLLSRDGVIVGDLTGVLGNSAIIESKKAFFRKKIEDTQFGIIGLTVPDGTDVCFLVQKNKNGDVTTIFKGIDNADKFHLLAASPVWNFRNYGDDSPNFRVSATIDVIAPDGATAQQPYGFNAHATGQNEIGIEDFFSKFGVYQMLIVGRYAAKIKGEPPPTERIWISFDIKGHTVEFDLSGAMDILDSDFDECLEAGR